MNEELKHLSKFQIMKLMWKDISFRLLSSPIRSWPEQIDFHLELFGIVKK